MCIAIFLPSYKKLDFATLKRCDAANPDGFGFAFFDDKMLRIQKYVEPQLNDMDKHINDFISLRERFIDKPFLVHFRIATHGKITTRCCHPFKINDDMVFCHNGILRYDYGVNATSNDSDTMMFNKNILQKLDKETLNNVIKRKDKAMKQLLEGYIGGGNKMILLNREGHFCILNEDLGIWDGGIWFSNTSYKKHRYQQTKIIQPTMDDWWYGKYGW